MIFYGSHGKPPEDEVAYRNYFETLIIPEQGFYIECGAGIGGNACHFFEAILGWRGFNLEASSHKFELLKKYRIDPLSTNLLCGLSNKNGHAIFTDVISAPGGGGDNGSFSHTPAHKKLLDGYECVYEDMQTEIWKYSTLFNNLHMLGHVPHINYLSLDVEGHEVQVLEGMKGSMVLPDVMSIEYPISGLDAVITAVKELSTEYSFNFISHNNAFFSRFTKESWWGTTERIEDL